MASVGTFIGLSFTCKTQVVQLRVLQIQITCDGRALQMHWTITFAYVTCGRKKKKPLKS